jgi:hypothetical protein
MRDASPALRRRLLHVVEGERPLALRIHSNRAPCWQLQGRCDAFVLGPDRDGVSTFRSLTFRVSNGCTAIA